MGNLRRNAFVVLGAASLLAGGASVAAAAPQAGSQQAAGPVSPASNVAAVASVADAVAAAARVGSDAEARVDRQIASGGGHFATKAEAEAQSSARIAAAERELGRPLSAAEVKAVKDVAAGTWVYDR